MLCLQTLIQIMYLSLTVYISTYVKFIQINKFVLKASLKTLYNKIDTQSVYIYIYIKHTHTLYISHFCLKLCKIHETLSNELIVSIILVLIQGFIIALP